MSLIASVDKAIREKFGSYLERELSLRDYKHSALAKKIGISAPHMHRILKGVNFPSNEALEIIATELGISKRELLKAVSFFGNLADYLPEGEVE